MSPNLTSSLQIYKRPARLSGGQYRHPHPTKNKPRPEMAAFTHDLHFDRRRSSQRCESRNPARPTTTSSPTLTTGTRARAKATSWFPLAHPICEGQAAPTADVLQDSSAAAAQAALDGDPDARENVDSGSEPDQEERGEHDPKAKGPLGHCLAHHDCSRYALLTLTVSYKMMSLIRNS